jgi:hypothetical protein
MNAPRERGKMLTAWIEEHLDPDGDDCLIWPFARNTDSGYAVKGGAYVHVIVCQKTHGDPPTSEHEAAHSCGNGHKGCVHPRHLRWATTAENHADKRIHGTMATGRRNGNAVLTEDNVRYIRSAPKERTTSALAKELGAGFNTVRMVRIGKSWTHLEAS